MLKTQFGVSSYVQRDVPCSVVDEYGACKAS